jgi:hypothetical protein
MTITQAIIVGNVFGAVLASALTIGLEEAICAWRVRNYMRGHGSTRAKLVATLNEEKRRKK